MHSRVAIPIVAYGYIGVEIVAVTALEAKDPRKSLKYPAKLIAWLTAAIYFLSALGFYLNVAWTDPWLPALSGRLAHGTTAFQPSSNTTQTSSVLVIAVLHASIPTLPGFINGCLVMAVLSAANTALYVSSRTLFGLTREIDPDDKYWWWIAKLSTTTPHRKVPAAALFLSAAAFCWVPFLHLNKGTSDLDLQEILSGVATVAVVLVWGSQCLAFIRYRMWSVDIPPRPDLANETQRLRRFRKSRQLIDDYPEYNHWSANNTHVPFSTTLGWLQPIPAYFGLIFCILTVFVFATSSWWNGGERQIDIWSAVVGVSAIDCSIYLKQLN
jgi:amino acid transporter